MKPGCGSLSRERELEEPAAARADAQAAAQGLVVPAIVVVAIELPAEHLAAGDVH